MLGKRRTALEFKRNRCKVCGTDTDHQLYKFYSQEFDEMFDVCFSCSTHPDRTKWIIRNNKRIEEIRKYILGMHEQLLDMILNLQNEIEIIKEDIADDSNT